MTAADIKAWYLNRIQLNLPFILKAYRPERGLFLVEEGSEHLYMQALRPLAWFFHRSFEGNPHYHNGKILQMIQSTGDALATRRVKIGGEWTLLGMVECTDWLAKELGPERVATWKKSISDYIEAMLRTNNYIATAPNHFIWRGALFWRAGKQFGREDWCNYAKFLARQVCRMQTAEGYWDEAHRGHGPSPNYHRVHLHGLDLYQRFSGDNEVLEPLMKAIAFAVRAAWPDGTPIETFDGRQPYLAAFAVGMAANALSRTPEGRRLIERQIERMEKLGVTDATQPTGFALSWYAFATTDFMLDCHRFVDDGEPAPLPQESSGHQDRFAFGGTGGTGGGALFRKGRWMVAASAIESDVPRFISNVYIAERQSGFSLFHASAGLIGGGGNRMRNHVPLANAIVLSGGEGVDCKAGVFPDASVSNRGLPAQGSEGRDPIKAAYHPIQRRVELKNDRVALFLEFLHASIRLEVIVINDRYAEIEYAYEAPAGRKLLLQLPVPLFYPGKFLLDGRPLDTSDLHQLQTRPLRTALELNAQGHQVNYQMSEGESAYFTYAMEPIKNWQLSGTNYVPDHHFKPLYTLGLISREFTLPGNRSGTLVSLEVDL